MTWNPGTCSNCRRLGRACAAHASVSERATNTTYDADGSDIGLFIDSSGNPAVGSSTGIGVDVVNGAPGAGCTDYVEAIDAPVI
jgi:hypothetical protein